VPQPSMPWTVAVFMVVSEDAQYPWALIDLRDIERIGKVAGFNVVVEVRWHRTPAERFLLRDGELTHVECCPPGDDDPVGTVLETFLRETHRDYPSDNYLLMLWGHSYGCGFGRTRADRLSYSELATVLEKLQETRGGRKLEILACNTCRVGKVEAIYELERNLRYLVASQLGVPFQGWPMHAVLSDLVDEPAIDPERLASQMVARYCDWHRSHTVTMTMLDLEGTATVVERVRVLSHTLLTEAEQTPHELRRLHEAFVRASNEDELTEPAVDLVELCCHLAETTDSDAVRRATASLLDLLRDRTLIARHDGTGPGADRLHGLGVYVPHVGLDHRAPVFSALGLEHARLWCEATSHLGGADRHAQLLAAIDLCEAEMRAVDPLQPAATAPGDALPS
jgi:Clostripain family